MTDARRHDAIALAILALLITMLFAEVLAGTRVLYTRDLTTQHFANKKVLREIVLGGEFPYWIRAYSAGQPLAANPGYTVFYPLVWLILLPNYLYGFQLLLVIHVYIAAFAMYAWIRSMRARAPAAALGAFSYALGGVLLSTINIVPFLFCAAWLPLTCLFARRHLQSGSRRDFALASLFLGLQLLSGELSIVLQTGMLLGMYAMYRGYRDGGAKRAIRNVAAVGAISAAALAVAAVQMIPAVDFLGDSMRSRPIDFKEAAGLSMPPIRLAELVYPEVLGHPLDDRVGVYWGNGIYGTFGIPFYFALYPGLLITGAAIAGLLLRRRGSRLLAAAFAASLLLALGRYTPLYDALHAAGLTNFVRHPEKFMFIGVFSTIVFGSLVVDELLQGDERVRRSLTAIAVVTAIFAAVLLFTIQESGFRTIWHLANAYEVPVMLALSRRGWLFAIARALLLVLALRATRTRVPLTAPALILFALIDLTPVAIRNTPGTAPEFFYPPAAARRLSQDRGRVRLFHYVEWGTELEYRRTYFDRREGRYWAVRNAMMPNLPMAFGVPMVLGRDVDRTNLLPTADFANAAWALAAQSVQGWIDTAASMSNVGYVGIYKPLPEALREAGGDFRKIQPVQFVEGRRYPRYSFASDVVPIRDVSDFVRKLGSGRHDKRTAFVTGAAFTPSRGVVHAWSETANTARIDVESAGRGFLVMSVTPHKYWTLTIDGRPARAVITNVGYQGVVVPAGRHVVEMRYRNPLVPIGAGVSFLALAGLAVLARRR